VFHWQHLLTHNPENLHSMGLLIKQQFVNFLPEFEDAREFNAMPYLQEKIHVINTNIYNDNDNASTLK
jgi:hypothetical protein